MAKNSKKGAKVAKKTKAVAEQAIIEQAIENTEAAAQEAAMQDMMNEADTAVEVLETEVETTAAETDEANAELTELQKAEAEAKRLKELLASAKAKLAEAKAAQKAANGRPVRFYKFCVYVIDAEFDSEYGIPFEGEPLGIPIFESDVHYRAEKVAIDAAKEEGGFGHMWLLYSVHKETGKARLVNKIYNSLKCRELLIN